MKTYIIRRLLLMPLTLLGVTFLVFCITRFVPGGPIEQMMQQQSMSALSGQKAGSQRGDNNLSEADMERLEEQYSLQEPIITAYLQWLGVLPKKIFISREEFGEIGGAGLDVYEMEPRMAEGLKDCPNTVLLPHIGSATHSSRDGMAVLAAKNIEAMLGGTKPPTVLNPEVLK